jgi:hypothetical protein
MLHFQHVILWFVDALPEFSNLILVVVGVILCLPKWAEKVEASQVTRFFLVAICLLLGIGGFVTSINQKHQATSDMTALIGSTKTLIANTDTEVRNTNEMVQTFSVLIPRVDTLKSQIADLKLGVESAKGNPTLIADLKSQLLAKEAQQATLRKTMLLAMAPAIINEMNFWADKFNMDDYALERSAIQRKVAVLGAGNSQQQSDQIDQELRKRRLDDAAIHTAQITVLMTSANSLREQLLASSELTQEDKTNAAIFAKVLAGQPILYSEMQVSARYMDSLVRRNFPNSAKP